MKLKAAIPVALVLWVAASLVPVYAHATPPISGATPAIPHYGPPPSPTIPPAPGITSVEGKTDSYGHFLQVVTAFSDDSLCKIVIPPDTVGVASNGFPFKEITMVKAMAPAAPPANTSPVGLIYTFGPAGATFSPPVPLTMSYNPSLIPSGVSESRIYIAQYDSATGWVKQGSTIDTGARTVTTANISHFSDFAIFAPSRPPVFTTGSLTITPAQVNVNDPVTVSITVTNNGDLTGTYRLTLRMDDAVVETKDLTVPGGTSQIISFTIKTGIGGIYTVNLGGLSGTLTVKAPAPTATPSPTPTPTATVTPAPSPSPSPTATPTPAPVPTPSPATPTVAPPIPTTPAPAPSPAAGPNLPLIIGIVVGLGVIGLAVYFATRRKGKTPAKPS